MDISANIQDLADQPRLEIQTMMISGSCKESINRKYAPKTKMDAHKGIKAAFHYQTEASVKQDLFGGRLGEG